MVAAPVVSLSQHASTFIAPLGGLPSSTGSTVVTDFLSTVLPVSLATAGTGKGGGQDDGIWPAHWLMPTDGYCWPDHGEIDITEMMNGDGVMAGTYHWNRLFPNQTCTPDWNTTNGHPVMGPPPPPPFTPDWNTTNTHLDMVCARGRSLLLSFFLPLSLSLSLSLPQATRRCKGGRTLPAQARIGPPNGTST
jgi:hypothetical protein